MSWAPRPRTSPSTTSPAHGSKVHSDASAGTVSTWPSRHRVSPVGLAGELGDQVRAPRLGGEQLAARSRRRASRSASSSWAGASLPGRVDGVEADQLPEQLHRLGAEPARGDRRLLTHANAGYPRVDRVTPWDRRQRRCGSGASPGSSTACWRSSSRGGCSPPSASASPTPTCAISTPSSAVATSSWASGFSRRCGTVTRTSRCKANIACEATDSIALATELRERGGFDGTTSGGARVQRRRLAELAQRPAPPLTRFILTGMNRLFETDDAPGERRRAPRCRPPRRRSRCACGPRRSTSSSARSTCSARARRCAPRSRPASRTR